MTEADYTFELDAALAQIDYPKGFLQNYDQLECLAAGHGTETFLVRKRNENKLFVAKCYDRDAYKAVHESAILRTLSFDGLPVFTDEYQDEHRVCIVREFIEGTPLDKYMAGHSLSTASALFIAARLCDILTYLHSRTPPVIHRDIKPQNIVVRQDGDIALIDFDIARTYADDAEVDTQFIGTRAYAPPEQYGFSQTDCRADIYSLGVLLCFMLTGQTNVKNARIADKRLAAIVHGCAAFAPEQRFSSAAEVKKALLRVGGGKIKRTVYACGACFAALVLLCAGYALGRYTDFLKPPEIIQGAVFAEPLMEKAVRAQLGKESDAPITEDELLSVRGVYLFGTEVSATQDAFMQGLNGWTLPRGGVTSLKDVLLLPNLEELYVNYQSLRDLSAVSALQSLRYLDVRHTFTEDISALQGLPRLENVVLYDTNVSDISALAACPRLEELEIGRTLIDGFSDLSTLPALKRLSLRDCSISALTGIERFSKLERVCITGTGVKDLTPLLSLENLKEVYLDESMRSAAEALGETSFTFVYE